MRSRIVFALIAASVVVVSGCKKRATTNDKPILYLYPEEVTEVTVRFADEDSVEMTYTYPDYGADGWRVIAHPDGTLYDLETNDQYYALFWEGYTASPGRLGSGSVISDRDTVAFLEDSLDQLGLNAREANEFIVYWGPILEENRFNFIHFSTDAWDELVPLEISPPPDSLVRIMMYYSPARGSMKVTPQTFEVPERGGFTVVEWGGRLLHR